MAELIGHVIGVTHPFKVILMTSKALRRRAVELAVGVTGSTINGRVRA